jgi:hypothetical protein
MDDCVFTRILERALHMVSPLSDELPVDTYSRSVSQLQALGFTQWFFRFFVCVKSAYTEVVCVDATSN